MKDGTSGSNKGPFGTVRLVSDGGLFGDFLLERCGPGTISAASASDSCSGMPSTRRDVERLLLIDARCWWEGWTEGNSAVPLKFTLFAYLNQIRPVWQWGNAINALFDEQIGDWGAGKISRKQEVLVMIRCNRVNASHRKRHHIVHTGCTQNCV